MYYRKVKGRNPTIVLPENGQRDQGDSRGDHDHRCDPVDRFVPGDLPDPRAALGEDVRRDHAYRQRDAQGYENEVVQLPEYSRDFI
jgi:hypothetical protein